MGLVSTQRRSSYGQPWDDEEICMSSYEVCRHHQVYPGMGQGPDVSPLHHCIMSANEKVASRLFDQSEAEKLAHDPSDEF